MIARDENFNQSNAFGAPYPKPGLCIVCQFEMSTRISYYAETAPRGDDDDDVKKKG